MENLIDIREDEIEKNGLPYCKKCGEPRFFKWGDKIMRCVCSCQQKEDEQKERAEENKARESLFRNNQKLSMIGARYLDVTFEKSDIDDSNGNAYKSCINYCNNADKVIESNIGMYLYGENSTGKTHLTACMCNELVRKGYNCLFTSVTACIGEIQKSYNNKLNDTLGLTQVMDTIASKDFVFIDDVGKEFIGAKSGYAEKILLEMINARYNNAKPTIFTSNYSIKQLDERFGLDRKIIEQMGEMSTKMIYLTGCNYRKKNYKNKKNILAELGI